MVKLPAFMFYPGDWRKDTGVQSLTYEERGVWFEMICFMWESEQRGKLVLNGKKMDENDISRLLGLDVSQTSKILATLLAKGVAKVEQNTGIIFCKRIIDEEHIRKVRAEAGYLGGSKTQAKRQAKSTPSVSVSSSNSISKDKNNIPLPLSGDNVCTYCGVSQKNSGWAFDMDHFLPKIAGGSDDSANLILCCHVCNQIKSKRIFKTIDEARETIHKILWTKNRQRYLIPRKFCFNGLPPKGDGAEQTAPVAGKTELSENNGQTPLADAVKPYPDPKTLPPVGKVVYIWKVLAAESPPDDRGWDKRNWSRASKSAKVLLEYHGGDVRKTVRYMQSFAKEYKEKSLSFTLETMVKNFDMFMSSRRPKDAEVLSA